MYFFDGMSTPIGRIHLVATDDALVRLYLPRVTWNDHYRREPKHPIILQVKNELREYFSGQRKTFSVPVLYSGTIFQERVWRVLREIPYGTTVSYTEVARRAECSSAVRAVGTATGKNPIPIIIPCHRVISLHGGVGGYAGGKECKMRLLSLEQEGSGNW